MCVVFMFRDARRWQQTQTTKSALGHPQMKTTHAPTAPCFPTASAIMNITSTGRWATCVSTTRPCPAAPTSALEWVLSRNMALVCKIIFAHSTIGLLMLGVELLKSTTTTAMIQLHTALLNDCVGHALKSPDIGSKHHVTRAGVLLRGGAAALVNVPHDVLELLIHFFQGPGHTHCVLRHL